MRFLAGKWIGAPELGVEVGRVGIHRRQRVSDLVVNCEGLFAEVFQGPAGAAMERHFPVAVEAAAGIDAHRQRIHRRETLPAVGKKISDRAFN